ncbi:DNA repair protein RecN [Pseudogemmatithrix spongiicola]|uniref:DNA repair protein RecN n=1 Tax=Pseudogemmatithrix spongiicola TaxID=3062599 RepID=A0AA49JUT6_9BACT|nr:DNA repair protein RecN [Gemmatimonadaceae bacterium 'strain 138']WKW15306.1 DNA repair protein RecN [Gemmatimonadaceae bacterium 'strain 318']
MLTELRIKNLAIIDAVTLPLASGFNVLTGETGAGKSIIVGALGLLIGERASSDLVRTGADKATVEGVFDLHDRPDLLKALDERGIECEDGILVLKREVASGGGRARAWVNGSPVTASVLAEIGRTLVNVHGQHEAQALLEPEAQRHILDAFGEAERDVQAVAEAWREAEAARQAIASLQSRRDDAAKRADWLSHVAKEIGEAQLKEGEDERLDEEARRLTHAEELQQLVGELTGTVESDAEAMRALGHLQKPLAALQKIDPSTAKLQELYDNAWYALEELAREAQAYAETVEHDPARLAEVDARRDLLFRLMKKYGGSIEAVMRTGKDARAELDLLDTASLDMRGLEQRVQETDAALQRAAAALTKKRRAAATALAKAVEARLPDLGMPDGRVLVHLAPRETIGASGAEDVEFRVALNVGHEARALARVASGGELARVMLALKTILARLDNVPTLIFDEVDAGIGGRTGLMIGDAMRDVAAHHQVFAITHLPQIAARAHHHIVVQKAAKGGVTTSDVGVVVEADRVDEIARMLGGDSESVTSREHARELLATAAAGAATASGAATRGRAGETQRPKRRV